MKRLGLFCFVLCASLLSSISSASLLDSLIGKSEPKFLPVEQAFPLTTELGAQQLTARWNSAAGYYLYKHRIFLQQGDVRLEPSFWSLPGIEKDDEAFGLVTAFYGPLEVHFDISQLQPGPATLHHQGCADAGLCYPPQRSAVEISAEHLMAPAQQEPSSSSSSPNSDATDISNSDQDSWFANRSALAVIGIFFLLGLGLTFTPCVLPMVPILTSIVLGKEGVSGKRGFLLSSTYVIGMALTYAAAGLAMGLLGAGANIQAWMQTPWVLVVFALLFVLLALSMFGLYELQLPRFLRDRLDHLNRQQQGGQWASVFVMGMLSALVVSPCVSAPLAGALVYISSTGDAVLGGGALLALGLGMGAPLIVLGTTGASFLPKSGSWMNQVKVFFGVLLIGVAIWLIARLLPDSISLILWGALALVYAVILGALETTQNNAQRVKKGFALLLLVYGILAIAGGLMGNSDPLKPLANQANGNTQLHAPFIKTESISELESWIASAPGIVMLDLYADWCISCKVMDKNIFAQADIQDQLSHITWLQLDITDNRPEHVAFLQKYAVFGPPTILFFAQQQELSIKRIVGEVDKAEFIKRVQGL